MQETLTQASSATCWYSLSADFYTLHSAGQCSLLLLPCFARHARLLRADEAEEEAGLSVWSSVRNLFADPPSLPQISACLPTMNSSLSLGLLSVAVCEIAIPALSRVCQSAAECDISCRGIGAVVDFNCDKPRAWNKPRLNNIASEGAEVVIFGKQWGGGGEQQMERESPVA